MIFYRLFFLFFITASVTGSAEIPREAEEFQCAGSLLMDRSKLEKAWDIAPVPEIAASLTNAWLFETNIRIDEELLGTPPFLEILSDWEQKEPDNALIPCLREIFLSSRESRFPEWDRFKRDLGLKDRIFFHYAPVRRASLKFLLERRGNNIKSWIYWLGGTSLQNVERVIQLSNSCLMEARFLIFTGQREKGRALLDMAEKISRMIVPEEDEIALRKLSVMGGVIQEKIIYELSSKDASRVEKLISDYRENVKNEKKISSRLSVLTGLQKEFNIAYNQAYEEIKPLTWNAVYSVDAKVMSRLADAIYKNGTKAVEDLWSYRVMPLDDFTRDLENNIDIFQEKEISRAAAGRFMDYLRKNIVKKTGMPTWTIPAFAMVKKYYPNAAGLGRRTLNEDQQKQFRWLLGALSFLTSDKLESNKTGEWIQAFKNGKTRPYLLLAFAKWKLKAAIPVVIATFRDLSKHAPSSLLLDYGFCLRALTEKDFGLNAEKWWQWQLKNKNKS